MDVPERAVCDLLDKMLIVIRGRAVTVASVKLV
jgi:hypothetical protein